MADYEGAEKWDGGITDESSKAGNIASDVAAQVKDRVVNLKRSAEQKVDETRGAAAEALQSTANSLRSGGQSSGEAIAGLASQAAEEIESTAQYVREHDMGSMMKDLDEVIRRSPMPSLCAAIGFGFLLGAALRGRS